MSAYGKALGQHIPFEGRLAIGFKIMLLMTLVLLICLTTGSPDEAYGCVVWVYMAPRYLVCVSLNRKFSLCL